jgi:hypothetical protein
LERKRECISGRFPQFHMATKRTDVHGYAAISIQHPGKQHAELARLLTSVRRERGVQAPLKTALGIPFGFAVPDQVNFGVHPPSKIRLLANGLKLR